MRPPRARSTVVTAVMLAVTAVLAGVAVPPAEAASGRLVLSEGGRVVRWYQDPQVGCYPGPGPASSRQDRVDNHTDSDVLVFPGPACQYVPTDHLEPHESRYVSHLGSVWVLH